MNNLRRVQFYVGSVEVVADVTHHTRDDRSNDPTEPDESFLIDYQAGEDVVQDWRDVAILAYPTEFSRYEDSLSL